MRKQFGNMPMLHDYQVPFPSGSKKTGYFFMVVGLLLIVIGKDDSMILFNFSLFWVNFCKEKIENNRTFRIRYQSLKMTLFSTVSLLLSLSLLVRFASGSEKYNLEPYFILILINLLYFLYFQFYKFFMKD